MSEHFAGKVVVITGGSTGIGLATAKRFIEDGAQVFVTGRRTEELEQAVRELGPQAYGISADVASVANQNNTFEQIARRAAHIDVLVLHAGTTVFEALGTITEEAIDRQFAVNVKGAILTMQSALPLLREGASVVLVSSITAQKAVPMQSVYAASKAALRSLARTWSSELKGRGIRVYVVSPGPVDSPGSSTVLTDPGVRQMIASATTVGRIGTPQEVAGVIAFVASDEASFVNGADFAVDGGLAQV